MEYLQKRAARDRALPGCMGSAMQLLCACATVDESEFLDQEDEEVVAAPNSPRSWLPGGLRSAAIHPIPMPEGRRMPNSLAVDAAIRGAPATSVSSAFAGMRMPQSFVPPSPQLQADRRSQSPASAARLISLGAGAAQRSQPALPCVPASQPSSVTLRPPLAASYQPPMRQRSSAASLARPLQPHPADGIGSSVLRQVSARESPCAARPRASYRPPVRQESVASPSIVLRQASARDSSVSRQSSAYLSASTRQLSAVPSAHLLPVELLHLEAQQPPGTPQLQAQQVLTRQASEAKLGASQKANPSLSRMSTASSLHSLLDQRELSTLSGSVKLQAASGNSARRRSPLLSEVQLQLQRLQSASGRSSVEGIATADTIQTVSPSSAFLDVLPGLDADVSLTVEPKAAAVRSNLLHTASPHGMQSRRQAIGMATAVSPWVGRYGPAV